MNAEEFLCFLQEEVGESMEYPWAQRNKDSDGAFESWESTFSCQRIMNVLHFKYLPTGNEFTVEVRDKH